MAVRRENGVIRVHLQTDAQAITALIELVGYDLNAVVGQLLLQVLCGGYTDVVPKSGHLILTLLLSCGGVR